MSLARVVVLLIRAGRRSPSQRPCPCSELAKQTAAGVGGQVRSHPPAHAGHARVQALLVAQPLMDRRHRHPRAQLPGDPVPVRVYHRPRHLPQPVIDQLREPFRREPAPIGPHPSAAARSRPRPPGRCTCAASCDPTPRLAASSFCDRPAYQWVKISTTSTTSKVLANVRSRSRCSATRRSLWSSTGPTRERHPRAAYGELRDRRVGNYLIASPSNLGNFMIADNWCSPGCWRLVVDVTLPT